MEKGNTWPPHKFNLMARDYGTNSCKNNQFSLKKEPLINRKKPACHYIYNYL